MGRKKKDEGEKPEKKKNPKKPGRVENLIPLNLRTKEEQRAIAANGGRKSQAVQKQKKLMSAIYAEFLAKKHKVKLGDEAEKEVDGTELMEIVSRSILDRGDSASVSLMKEIREATEGSKIAINTSESPIDPAKLDDETKAKIAQAYIASMETNGKPE